MKEKLPNNPLSNTTLIENIENIFLQLYKKYNVDRARYLELDKIEVVFNPVIIIGFKSLSNRLYLLKDAMMIPNNTITLGSGKSLAQLVLKQLNRSISIFDAKINDCDIETVIKFSSYIINEVKGSDLQSGGETKLISIDNKQVKELSNEEVENHYNEFVKTLIESFKPVFKDQVSEDKMSRMFPPTK